MPILLALSFAAVLGVSGASAPSLVVDAGPLVRAGTVDGCAIWEGALTVRSNVSWRLTIDVVEPCGPWMPEAGGAPSAATTVTYRIGTRADEPAPFVVLGAAP